MKTISIPRWAIVVIMALIIVGGVWILLKPSLAGHSTSGAQETDLEAAAEEISVAILDLDYNDQAGWKDRLYPLCSQDGQRFWEGNLSNGMWQALGTTVTDQVTISTVEVQKAEQGFALVIVRGQTLFHSEGNESAQTQKDFVQMLVLQQTNAGWRFVALANT